MIPWTLAAPGGAERGPPLQTVVGRRAAALGHALRGDLPEGVLLRRQRRPPPLLAGVGGDGDHRSSGSSWQGRAIISGFAASLSVGLLLFLPKLLHSPLFFNFFDQLAHVWTLRHLSEGGGLFVENPINKAVEFYPGLESAAGVLTSATGLSEFVAGNILIGGLHALLAGALFLFYERVADSPRVALLWAGNDLRRQPGLRLLRFRTSHMSPSPCRWQRRRSRRQCSPSECPGAPPTASSGSPSRSASR